jgi:hypothetical protein
LTRPVGKVGGVIVNAGFTVMLRVVVVAVLPCESVTLMANCKVPVVVGVPLMTPVLDPIVSGDNEPLATANV